MEQQPTPIIEIIELILLMGSITYLLGAGFQLYNLRKNRKSFLKSLAVILVTRCLTIPASFFIWSFWNLPFDIMFFFIFLPAFLPEVVLSPLMLKVFGNRLMSFTVKWKKNQIQ
ncbi:hypothetical protein BY457_12343 [Marinilabilia salmonicolor]|jgi:hypothetical protein|nr:hypothetical protein BY457_12343 [Marinilabilia salmonicolor]